MSPLHQKNGSAIIIALVVLTLLTVMSTVFFEKLYRFSQASEGIENSNVAYYKALGIIESSLFTGSVSKYTPWNVANGSAGSVTSSGQSISVSTGGTSVPVTGKGNSPYDPNYNIISLGEPIQLVVPNGINWDTVNFQFRIPDIGGNTGVVNASSWFILWTLASSWASLFASGETNIFKGNALNNIASQISTYNGTSNSWSSVNFKAFYESPFYLWTTGSNCTWFQCTLKLSLIKPVTTLDGRSYTFLEYRISGFGASIPSQYMDIHAEGYAYGFLRTRDLKFPQITTNTALDFAVLQ
jgi:hypothetical protein